MMVNRRVIFGIFGESKAGAENLVQEKIAKPRPLVNLVLFLCMRLLKEKYTDCDAKEQYDDTD